MARDCIAPEDLDALIENPCQRVEAVDCRPHRNIPLPLDLYGEKRRNSVGWDLSDPDDADKSMLDGDNITDFVPLNDPRVYGNHRLFRVQRVPGHLTQGVGDLALRVVLVGANVELEGHLRGPLPRDRRHLLQPGDDLQLLLLPVDNLPLDLLGRRPRPHRGHRAVRPRRALPERAVARLIARHPIRTRIFRPAPAMA